jgi:uncharacterized protein YybS (DUF2232 family)
MTLLNIFHSGLLGPVVILLGLGGLFLIGRAIYRRNKVGISVFKTGYSIWFLVVLVLWIIALVSIASDYKGV